MNRGIKARGRLWSSLIVGGLGLLWASPAYANNPPGGNEILAEIMILPLMALFTVLGGGYAVMRARGIKLRRQATLIFAFLAILLSGIHEGFAGLAALIFGYMAFSRAVRMIAWGVAATRADRSRDLRGARPPSLPVARPTRLIAAGLMLSLTTLAAVQLAMAFPNWRYVGSSDFSTEQDLKRLVAYQLFAGTEHRDASGNRTFETPQPPEPVDRKSELRFESLHVFRGGDLYQSTKSTEYRLGPGGRSFQVWAWPDRFPLFPYNYVVTRPSFYADESGQIRMIRVHRAGQRCPIDAPVYYRVRPEDTKTYVFTGKVGAVDETTKTLTVDDGKVEGWALGGGAWKAGRTMDYRVDDRDDPAMLKAIRVGDQISAMVYETSNDEVVSGHSNWVLHKVQVVPPKN